VGERAQTRTIRLTPCELSGAAVQAAAIIPDTAGEVAMTFEETLGALLAMVGQRVDVTVSSAYPLVMVASYEGTLARGDDIEHPSREGETFMFGMQDAAVAFILEQHAFVGAGYVGADATQGLLEIRVGSAILTIDAVDRADVGPLG